MKSNLEQIKKKALPILKQAGVTRSAVFGSHARGEQRQDSDLDMLVELPRGNTLLDLVRLQRKLEQGLGKKVDLTTYKSLSPLIRKYVQQDQIEIL